MWIHMTECINILEVWLGWLIWSIKHSNVPNPLLIWAEYYYLEFDLWHKLISPSINK